MSAPVDLEGIRARDAAVTPADMKLFSAVAQAAHDDRATLLDALDRLAAVTEADILLAIKFCATDREQAAAVVALLRARVEG